MVLLGDVEQQQLHVLKRVQWPKGGMNNNNNKKNIEKKNQTLTGMLFVLGEFQLVLQ
jgi:hypothetical protein